MNKLRLAMPGILSACILLSGTTAAAEQDVIGMRLIKIDEGKSWTNPQWGTNAYKLVHDGSHFYAIGHWGADRSVTVGRIYRLEGDEWVRGYEWDDLNYQPGMLLLDSKKRLVLVYPKMRAKPVVKRATAPGDFHNLEPLNVPDWFSPAGYVGVGIHDDVIVFGYIGDPEVYSFNVAIHDMKSGEWNGPFMLARSQREVEPYTTWRYPIIHPHDSGFHMTLSNGRDSTSFKHQVLYMDLPYDLQAPVTPIVVAEAVPWTRRMAQAGHMLVADDGSIFITGQYHEDEISSFSVWRRQPRETDWTRQRLSEAQVGAAYQNPTAPDDLWIMSSFGSELRLYKSQDHGGSWQTQKLPPIDEYNFDRTFGLHGVFAGSGSVIPDRPTAIFTSGHVPDYVTWFVQFDVPTEKEAKANAEGASR